VDAPVGDAVGNLIHHRVRHQAQAKGPGQRRRNPQCVVDPRFIATRYKHRLTGKLTLRNQRLYGHELPDGRRPDQRRDVQRLVGFVEVDLQIAVDLYAIDAELDRVVERSIAIGAVFLDQRDMRQEIKDRVEIAIVAGGRCQGVWKNKLTLRRTVECNHENLTKSVDLSPIYAKTPQRGVGVVLAVDWPYVVV